MRPANPGPRRGPSAATGWYVPSAHAVLRTTIGTVRAALGLPRHKLALAVGIPAPLMTALEHHEVVPTLDLLQRCAEILGVTPWFNLLEVEFLSPPEARHDAR